MLSFWVSSLRSWTGPVQPAQLTRTIQPVLFAGESLQESWHHTSFPQPIWWLDLPYIHFESFPEEIQCPQSCFEDAYGRHCCVACLFHTSHRKYLLGNGDISIWCVVSSFHPLMRRQWNVFPGASCAGCRGSRALFLPSFIKDSQSLKNCNQLYINWDKLFWIRGFVLSSFPRNSH